MEIKIEKQLCGSFGGVLQLLLQMDAMERGELCHISLKYFRRLKTQALYRVNSKIGSSLEKVDDTNSAPMSKKF